MEVSNTNKQKTPRNVTSQKQRSKLTPGKRGTINNNKKDIYAEIKSCQKTS